MTENTELTTEVLSAADTLALIEAQGEGKYQGALKEVTKSTFLPYIQLMSSNSREVKKGECQQGRFYLRKSKDAIDLGPEVVMFLIQCRPKAMEFQPKVKSFYDPTSPEFKTVMEKAELPNSHRTFGPEFLVWLPDHKEFASYYLGNKTGRNEAPKLMGVMETTRICVQEAFLIETPDYSWHGPRTKPYDLEIVMPPPGDLSDELQKFNSPPVTADEPTEEAEANDRA